MDVAHLNGSASLDAAQTRGALSGFLGGGFIASGFLLLMASFLVGAYTSRVQAMEAEAASSVACSTQPIGTGTSRQRFESTALMTVAADLESQGEADFHLKYDQPTAECLVESFAVSDARVTARYSPWEKGLSTLTYRFLVQRPTGSSEVLVVYSGMASFVSGGGYVFHVSEERDGVVSWYAMYRDDPAYTAVRSLVQDIVAGTAKPLLAVRWPKGAKKAEVVVYDTKRLK
jgi:hypothetical protein